MLSFFFKDELMRRLIYTLFFIFSVQKLYADDLILTGKIGDYSIEMIISERDWNTGEITGKYRYQSKKKYLDLTGQIQGQCLHIDESYKAEHTGDFYLSIDHDTLKGKWLSNTKYLEVKLFIQSGDKTLLRMKSLSDFIPEVSNEAEGTYQNEMYFLNDMWLSEDHLEMEIAFNGGKALIEQLSADSIKFYVGVVCGPTYHIAEAEGIAIKKTNGQEYLYTLNEFEEDDPCLISITLLEKAVKIEANGTMACGFGARAYLSHTFAKVSNALEYTEADNR